MVCGKCDARRLAASIDPHDYRRYRRRRRRVHACRHACRLRVHSRFLSHARGASSSPWADRSSAHLDPYSTGFLYLPYAAAASRSLRFRSLSPPSTRLSSSRLTQGARRARNRMTSRDLAPLSLHRIGRVTDALSLRLGMKGTRQLYGGGGHQKDKEGEGRAGGRGEGEEENQ